MVSDHDRLNLVALIHGELSPAEARTLSERLRHEEDLRKEYEALLAMETKLEKLFSQTSQADFSRDQIDHILARAGARPQSRRIYYTVAASAVAASLVLVLWTQGPFRDSTAVSPTLAKLEQVEQRASEEAKSETVLAESRTPEKNAPSAAGDTSAGFEGSAEPAASGVSVAQNTVSSNDSTEGMKVGIGAVGAGTADAIAVDRPSEASSEMPSGEDDAYPASQSLAQLETSKMAARSGKRAEVAASASWFSCTDSSDCTIVEDFCKWRAINKKHIKAFGKIPRSKPIECKTAKPDPAAKSRLEAICFESKCIERETSR